MTRQPSGTTSPNSPTLATSANPSAALSARRRRGEQAEQHGADARDGEQQPPAAAARTPAACSDDAARRAPRRRTPPSPARRSSHQLPEHALERVVERAHLVQAGADVAGQARAGRRPARRRSSTTRRCRRRRRSRPPPLRPASRAAASGARLRRAHQDRRGRSAMASRIARWSPAAASRPCIRMIWRRARRSTSWSTCELTITVRPWAPRAWKSCDERLALHRVGAVERLVEHQHRRVGHEGGRHLGALAHALAEPAHLAVGHVGQADRRRAHRSGIARSLMPCSAAV